MQPAQCSAAHSASSRTLVGAITVPWKASLRRTAQVLPATEVTIAELRTVAATVSTMELSPSSIDDAVCIVAGGRVMCHRQIPVIQALDELGGGLGLVDCLAACRAVPARLQWRPACGVRQRLAVGAAAATPVCE